MRSQRFRAPNGGDAIDRSRPIAFHFGGKSYTGFAGDTLASALLANGVRLGGRSFKLHRPRGLLAAGVEEANVLVEVGRGAERTANLRATEVELTPGLDARPVNAWPSLRFDLGQANSLVARFLKAGFYYKTFMWPTWHAYEGSIRRAAGLGMPSREADPARYEHAHAHCDVLVIGSGPAGLTAALAAARAGGAGAQRVMLVEQEKAVGGSLLWQDGTVGEMAGSHWAATTADKLQQLEHVRVLTRTTAIAAYDHNLFALVERSPSPGTRERLWTVRAKRVVLATGAFERPLLFPGNDRPGVMLASAAQLFVRRFGALAGLDLVIATNNSSAYHGIVALIAAGARVRAIVDYRASVERELVHAAEALAVRCLSRSRIVDTRGRLGVRSVDVCDGSGRVEQIPCDAVLMSGGWNPDVQLFSQAGGPLVFDDSLASFKPTEPLPSMRCVGAVNGVLALGSALAGGHAAGEWAVGQPVSAAPGGAGRGTRYAIEQDWRPTGDASATFVDFQNDVTVADIALAAQENFRSVEHLKRYTTLGMAVDQGKTSNVNALGVMGALTGRAPQEVGTTRFRPPYVPTSLSAYAGLHRGELYRPYRQTPLHDRHAALGATFEEYGQWLRPAHYLRPGEDREAAMHREALGLRAGVGLFDASPLGKIEVVGPDAAEFLDRIYANRMSNLGLGRARYGLMLSELGVIVDDGIAVRMAHDRFLVGTTSGGADRIAAMLEEWLQCEWRDLEVLVAPVTSLWGNLTIAGPAARQMLAAAGCDVDIDAAAFPHLAWREGSVAGLSARMARVSFTGELSYEVSVPAADMPALWDALAAAAAPLGGTPVGVDAWMLLRLEKGFLHVGTDTDGTTVPADVGWNKIVTRTGDFVGKRSLLWEVNRSEDRLQLVGLEPAGCTVPPIGMRLCGRGPQAKSDGFVTSSEFSPTLKRPVALGLVRAGRARIGQAVELTNGEHCRIVSPVGYDPDGSRMHG